MKLKKIIFFFTVFLLQNFFVNYLLGMQPDKNNIPRFGVRSPKTEEFNLAAELEAIPDFNEAYKPKVTEKPKIQAKRKKIKLAKKIKAEKELESDNGKKNRKLDNAIICALCKTAIIYENQLEKYKCGHCLHKACIIKAIQKFGEFCPACQTYQENMPNKPIPPLDPRSDLLDTGNQAPNNKYFLSYEELFPTFRNSRLLKMLDPDSPDTLD